MERLLIADPLKWTCLINLSLIADLLNQFMFVVLLSRALLYSWVKDTSTKYPKQNHNKKDRQELPSKSPSVITELSWNWLMLAAWASCSVASVLAFISHISGEDF